ncbi:hypothetical protein [Rothia sp. (in: high G+C Gram-positive bacteria)]|uniref:hypothetical protein n=1 Tax=Rothia sp. (in: high G+C Gram-positive bacteria) TaxID=1885016 RepID=UPI001CB3B3C9|nr:hypothetical protein [Rothia sp. (in: high G+C Gram-positive bacteria)]MBF1668901.1 hypothetical protein [Rothia sp. (in: high G+C Gram-positive bacteria)]
MDYPNLLETAFDEMPAAPTVATVPAAGNGAAGDSAGAPQLLIWRQIRWSNRRPLIEVEPVVPGGVPEGVHNRASQAEGESTPNQERSPAQRGVPSGVRIQISLTPGAYLGLRIPRDSEGELYRYCAGYTTGTSNDAAPESAGIRRVPCPEGTRIQRGQQCPRCTARDEFTALHRAHLYPGTLTESMRAYAMLEHRLYIATFPDGTHKVGTSSLHSTPRRLDEQAVATATYIALAPDGLAIRRAEDAVTALAKIPQVKQVASKYRAWTNPLPGAQLRVAHQEAVARAREALAELARTDPEVPLTALDEPWIPSLAMNRPYAALRAQSPEPLAPCESGLGGSGTESGAAGFFCTGAAGQFLSAHTGDADAAFLVNTAAWRNVLVEPAQEFTRVRVQGSLV